MRAEGDRCLPADVHRKNGYPTFLFVCEKEGWVMRFVRFTCNVIFVAGRLFRFLKT